MGARKSDPSEEGRQGLAEFRPSRSCRAETRCSQHQNPNTTFSCYAGIVGHRRSDARHFDQKSTQFAALRDLSVPDLRVNKGVDREEEAIRGKNVALVKTLLSAIFRLLMLDVELCKNFAS